jgi:hypothetical protein
MLFISLFTDRPIIWGYTVWAPDSVVNRAEDCRVDMGHNGALGTVRLPHILQYNCNHCPAMFNHPSRKQPKGDVWKQGLCILW